MDLGSLNIENIENILTSMSSEEFEDLKNTASALFSSFEKDSDKKETNKQKTSGPSFSGFDIDLESITKIMSVMERIKNQPEDPRCTFLRSLKPMLSNERKHKVDQAVKMMSLMSFLPIIQELGGKENA